MLRLACEVDDERTYCTVLIYGGLQAARCGRDVTIALSIPEACTHDTLQPVNREDV